MTEPGKNARKPLWMNKELLAKLKQKTEAYKGTGNLEGMQSHCLSIQG